MTEQELIEKFKNETGMDFFEAILRFYSDINEELLSYIPFTIEQLENCNWHFNDVYNELISIVNDKAKRRETIIWRRIDWYFEDSYKRCYGLKRRDTTWEHYLITKDFIDEDKLRDIITRNPHKWRNPLLLCNGKEGIIPCIFQPSFKLRERYPFIIQKYSSNWALIWVDINTELIDKQQQIYINEDDIWKFYYGLYHPYIWWLIQSWQRNKLVNWNVK